MRNYLKEFETALNSGASDHELEAIIDEACENIEDDQEYSDFYESAINMMRR